MKKSNTSHMGTLTSKLMLGTAIAGFAALAVSPAQAQNENITVTGTSIRGQQPVGANVISVDRAAIEATGAQTTAQLLVTIPQLDNFGSAAQGGQNSADGSGTQAPTIHSLGNSASNATLVLIDGHRIPLTGINHNLIDPSIIPTSAISNVEVLPDGASAIYGSDAVAGVINFHTRKDYSGWETSAQYGIADHYNTFNFSQMFGHSWEDGGLVAAYNYSSRSNLMNRNRDFITARQDLRRGAADPNLFPERLQRSPAPPGCRRPRRTVRLFPRYPTAVTSRISSARWQRSRPRLRVPAARPMPILIQLVRGSPSVPAWEEAGRAPASAIRLISLRRFLPNCAIRRSSVCIRRLMIASS